MAWLRPKNPQEGLVGGNKSFVNLFHQVPQSQNQETKREGCAHAVCHPPSSPAESTGTQLPGQVSGHLTGKGSVRGAYALALPEDLTAPTDLPLYLSNRLRVEYLLFPSLPWVICPKRSDIAMKCHLVRKFFSAPLPICLWNGKRGGQSPVLQFGGANPTGITKMQRQSWTAPKKTPSALTHRCSLQVAGSADCWATPPPLMTG